MPLKLRKLKDKNSNTGLDVYPGYPKGGFKLWILLYKQWTSYFNIHPPFGKLDILIYLDRDLSGFRYFYNIKYPFCQLDIGRVDIRYGLDIYQLEIHGSSGYDVSSKKRGYDTV